MKKILLYTLWVLLIALMSCSNDINVFDKTADERVAEAIANLKSELTAPKNGWRVKYKPASGSGSFYVLMDFKNDYTVNIKTDLGANNGEFYEQTITYRIDNSLGLELIMESYCFFSYLFEQDQATFPAEFEFIYVNKTGENLVFKSKSDPANNATVLLFEPAKVTDDALLGPELATNLNTIANDLSTFSSSLKLTYTSKDLIFYVSLNPNPRTISISSASKKSNTQATQDVGYEAGYIISGDSIVFDTPLTGSFLGQNISINRIKFNSLTDSEINICTDPIPIHSYSGVTSSGDAVVLETTIVNASGATFAKNEILSASGAPFFDNGTYVGNNILTDIVGAVAFQLYYNYDLGNGTKLNGIGFVIQNEDNTTTFALWEFTPTLVDNNLSFAFKPDVTIFGSPTNADMNKVKEYITHLTEGNTTYVLKTSETRYELYNPCTGWSAVVFV